MKRGYPKMSVGRLVAVGRPPIQRQLHPKKRIKRVHGGLFGSSPYRRKSLLSRRVEHYLHSLRGRRNTTAVLGVPKPKCEFSPLVQWYISNVHVYKEAIEVYEKDEDRARQLPKIRGVGGPTPQRATLCGISIALVAFGDAKDWLRSTPEFVKFCADSGNDTAFVLYPLVKAIHKLGIDTVNIGE